MTALLATVRIAQLTQDCPDLKLLNRGKVRDIYEVDADSLLFVATDRLSAFDVVMKNVLYSLYHNAGYTKQRQTTYRNVCILVRFP
jgi:hypothetical protein